MATHSSILAWKIPWTGEPGRLQSLGSQSWTCQGASIMSHSLQFYGPWPTRLLCLWNFSRQEYWSGLPFPPSGDLSDRPRDQTQSLTSPALAGSFFATSATWKSQRVEHD